MMSDFAEYVDNTGIKFTGTFNYDGAVGPQGPQGPAGYTPVKGVDYFTAQDITDIETDILTNVKATTGSSVDLSINSSTYVMTLNLKNANGATISTGSIDLPLESMVVSGSYDSVNKKIILTLQSGSTIEFSVADLVSGLQTEITNANKLSADLVDDTSTTNKFVTTAEKTTWGGKQDALTAGSNITITGNTIAATDTTYSAFTGTDGVDAGTTGLVPAPTTSDTGKYLKSDGTWATVTSGTFDYDDLSDKPQINSVTLSGNKTLHDLGIQKEFVNVLTSNQSYADGTAPSLQDGYYFTGDYTVEINNNQVFPENSYFYCVTMELTTPRVETITMLIGTSTMSLPARIEASYTNYSDTWSVVDYNYLLDSDISTTINSSSTNTQVAGAKAVYDSLPTDFTGTDGVNAGTRGLVPAPLTTDNDKYLKSDGTWATVQAGSTITYGNTDLTPRSITSK